MKYKSVQDRIIDVLKFGSGRIPVLIVGGVHGDEIEGIDVCDELIRRLDAKAFVPPSDVTIWILARANPDGTHLNQRTNANNVDLNRNLPTSNWRPDAANPRYPPGPAPASEPETQAFISIVEIAKPRLIISLHSYLESLLLYPANDINTPLRSAIDLMALNMNIPVVDKMNYEIYGSLSRWSLEQSIPSITIEILRTGTSNLTAKWIEQIQQLITTSADTLRSN